MMFPTKYSCLDKQTWVDGHYSIVPIRYEDRCDIMNWRNEQLYHLRQLRPLTKADQEHYFKNVVASLFEQRQPQQLLFSFMEGQKCIGYGGLVHINWNDRHAEISFIMDTVLEAEYFTRHWLKFLQLIEKLAFDELNLHKIYTYAFDLRPQLYQTLEAGGFLKEAVLKDHCRFEGKFIPVVIHSKIIEE